MPLKEGLFAGPNKLGALSRSRDEVAVQLKRLVVSQGFIGASRVTDYPGEFSIIRSEGEDLVDCAGNTQSLAYGADQRIDAGGQRRRLPIDGNRSPLAKG